MACRAAPMPCGASSPTARSGADLFPATQQLEERPFMRDWTLSRALHEMARATVPLVSIDPFERAVDLRRHRFAPTDAGRDVAAARRDAVALDGIDCRRGGVLLVGRDPAPWRWGERPQKVVLCGRPMAGVKDQPLCAPAADAGTSTRPVDREA